MNQQVLNIYFSFVQPRFIYNFFLAAHKSGDFFLSTKLPVYLRLLNPTMPITVKQAFLFLTYPWKNITLSLRAT